MQFSSSPSRARSRTASLCAKQNAGISISSTGTSTGICATGITMPFLRPFGPVERSRKGDAVLGGYEDYLIYDPPRQLVLKAVPRSIPGSTPCRQSERAGTAEDLFSPFRARIYQTPTNRLAPSITKGLALECRCVERLCRDEFFPSCAAVSMWLRGSLGKRVSLVLQRSRSGGRRPLQSSDQFLFRQLRQQLCRQSRSEALPRLQQFPGFEIDELSARISSIGGEFICSHSLQQYWNTQPLSRLDPNSGVGGLLIADPGARAERTPARWAQTD